MESIHKNRRKNDKVDARTLARLVRADPELLYPIRHRGIDARRSLVVLRAEGSKPGAKQKAIGTAFASAQSPASYWAPKNSHVVVGGLLRRLTPKRERRGGNRVFLLPGPNAGLGAGREKRGEARHVGLD